MTDASKRDQDIRRENRENNVIDVIVVVVNVYRRSIEIRIDDDRARCERQHRSPGVRGSAETRLGYTILRAVVLTFGVTEAASGDREHRQTEFRQENPGRTDDRGSLRSSADPEMFGIESI